MWTLKRARMAEIFLCIFNGNGIEIVRKRPNTSARALLRVEMAANPFTAMLGAAAKLGPSQDICWVGVRSEYF